MLTLAAIALLAYTLPDKDLTPGAVDPRVTQETIRYTICLPGWSAKVRPRAAVAHRIKLNRLKAYEIPAGRIKKYEEDHLIPLELGGHPVMKENQWPQIWSEAVLKDWLENALHKDVCSGRKTLEEARREIAGDWAKAFGREHRERRTSYK